MPTAEKEAFVEEFSGKLNEAKGLFLADFSGMDVATVTAMRADLRKRGVQYTVVKNTLLRLACRKNGLESLEPFLQGPTALAYSTESEVEAARALVDFAKEHDRPKVKAGVIGEKFYSMEEVLALAALPSREVLLSQVLGTLIAPMTELLGSVNALLASPAQLSDGLAKKQES